MLTKTILFALLGACGVAAGAPSNPEPALSPSDPEDPDGHNEETVLKDQHFCCQVVDPKAKSGEGCLTIGKGQVDQCPELLYCAGSYAKHDGKTYCL